MSDKIAWSEEIPPLPSARIWTPPDGRSHICVLGPWRSLWIHWLRKRSVPCLKENCPRYRHTAPGRWVAYVPSCVPILALDGTREVVGHRPIIIACNPEQAAALRPSMGNYPGPILTLFKHEKEKHWTLEKIITGKNPKDMPPCPDVLATLHRVWGIIPDFEQNGEAPPADGPPSDS